jgi:regulator of replication initiation timing
VKQGKNFLRRNIQSGIAFFFLLAVSPGLAQDKDVTTQDSTAAAIRELQQQVNELREAVSQMREETARYRSENNELRRELRAVGGADVRHTAPQENSYDGGASPAADLQASHPAATADSNNSQTASLENRVASLEESTQLLNSKLDDQYQSKVESGSKYRVRLSGIVLLNLFNSHGSTDNQDIPSFVTGPSAGTGNFGATMRQSEIGLEVFGPDWAGAKTSGSLQADFAGGFPNTWNGVDSGIFRLRTASMRLDWEHTSVVVGQDAFFLAPLSPTSFASLAVPALNYAGNLWAWTPQVRIEHRFDLSDKQNIKIQGGIFDNLTGEFPADSYFRAPQAGELSRQPAYGVRTSWTHQSDGQPLTFGAAGYYSRQDWPFDHYVDGWAGMADWQIPLSSRFAFSGEFYRGRAIGGIGGNIRQTVVYDGDPMLASTPVKGLDSIGGWSQLKFKATSTLEFNAAFGLDNPTTSELRGAEASQAYLFTPLFAQNRGALGNFVYRPRSNLLFSAEYRYLRTSQLYGISNNADQYNLMMGILF